VTDTSIKHFCINGMSARCLYFIGAISYEEFKRREKEEKKNG
jgi:hypothetical protein